MRLLLDESVPKRLRQHLPGHDVKTVPAYVPKAPDAIMAELWAFKRQANAAADDDI
jgi:predicted nuclease of predicted toxin-antitoxin system